MTRTPEITVAAVAATAGRFLFVEERINQRLVINQPAGHVEPGESLLAAVIREVREESAWRFEPQALLGVYLWRRPSARRATLRFAFTGTVSEHDATRRLDRGIVRTLWLSADGGRGTGARACAAPWSCAASRTTSPATRAVSRESGSWT